MIGSDLDYATTVEVEGKTGTLTQLDTQDQKIALHLDCYSKDKFTGDCLNALIVSQAQLTTQEIETQILAIGIELEGNDRKEVTVQTLISGEIELRDVKNPGQRITADISDLKFEYKTFYALASSVDTDGDGQNEDGSLNCNNPQTQDQIDKCEKEESNKCFVFGAIEVPCEDETETETDDQAVTNNLLNAILGAISGVQGDEAGSETQELCFDNDGFEIDCPLFEGGTFDDNTIIYILIIIGIIFVGVIIYSRRG